MKYEAVVEDMTVMKVERFKSKKEANAYLRELLQELVDTVKSVAESVGFMVN